MEYYSVMKRNEGLLVHVMRSEKGSHKGWVGCDPISVKWAEQALSDRKELLVCLCQSRQGRGAGPRALGCQALRGADNTLKLLCNADTALRRAKTTGLCV